MEHGLNTDFTNAGTNPCFICVPSVAEFCGFSWNKFAPPDEEWFSVKIAVRFARQAQPDLQPRL